MRQTVFILTTVDGQKQEIGKETWIETEDLKCQGYWVSIKEAYAHVVPEGETMYGFRLTPPL